MKKPSINPLIHDLLEKLVDPDEKIAENARHQLYILMGHAGGFDSYGEDMKRYLPPELQVITLNTEEQRAIVAHFTELIKSGFQLAGSLIFQMTRLHPLMYMDYLFDILLHHMDKLKKQHDVHQSIIALDNCLRISDSDEDVRVELDRQLEKNNPIRILESLLENPEVYDSDRDTFEHVLYDLRWRNHPLLQANRVKKAIVSGENLQDAPLMNIDLHGEDLRRANVAEASFAGGNLAAVNLEGVDLHACTFSDLPEANLRQSNLTDAELSFADVQNADLTGAILRNGDLQGANLEGCNFSDGDFTAANLVQANLLGAILTNSIFDDTTRLPNADFWTPDTDMTLFTNSLHPSFWRGYFPDRDDDENDDFSDADFSRANLQAANLSHAVLHRTNFSTANMRMVEISRSDCEGASFRNADLQQSHLIYANCNGTDLRGANLEDSFLWNSTFDGAQFDETTILPDGTQWTEAVDLARFTNHRHPEFDLRPYPTFAIIPPWERDNYPDLHFFDE